MLAAIVMKILIKRLVYNCEYFIIFGFFMNDLRTEEQALKGGLVAVWSHIVSFILAFGTIFLIIQLKKNAVYEITAFGMLLRVIAFLFVVLKILNFAVEKLDKRGYSNISYWISVIADTIKASMSFMTIGFIFVANIK